MSKPLRLVIFDLDGTVIDSLATITRSMTDAMAAHGEGPPAPELVRASIGLPLLQMYERVAPHLGHEQWDAMVRLHGEIARGRRARGELLEPLFPGARKTMDVLNEAGHLLAVSTSKSRAGTDHALAGHGITSLFVQVRCPDNGHMKPHPDAIHDVLAATGVEPERTVFVGDTQTDMKTAANAGVAAIGAGWGYHPVEQLLDTGAVAIAQDFAELPALVNELIGS